MHFDLLQSISLAGDLSVPNDDRAGSARAHAWVIDGATDLGPPGLVGAQGGAAWLASAAQAGFTASAATGVEALFGDVAGAILAAWARDRTREPEDRWEYPLASSLAVRLGAGEAEIGWLGDCVGFLWSAGAVTRLGPEKEIRNSEAERAASLAQHGLGKPKASAPILANLKSTRGRPGMRVLSIDPAHMARVDTSRIACAPGDEILLMSDGYAALIDSYAAYDDAGLVAAIRARGLAAIAGELRAIEQGDAACTRFPRFKISDDATALWLRIGG
ncbi:protein phosphatase 2C domain-containing protein [Sphingomonas sp. HITSZ_GF]|uniref:protein phosphatase 2C domain-containing protein n=1 Tax=Sphingomonas sp. HITSZ_GF TaxID=3037247 RepID=UPI00240E1A9F|nr:protein phosphatase 2C domain-containing protein [Sphingomonas sp. HITSZ_GF]MDG2533411.1 protein phosphatase 2C domain-containing protein [Sphingomonas sp. HITSZ_GF]